MIGFIATEISAQEEDSLSSAVVGVVAQGVISTTITVTVSTSDGTAQGKQRMFSECSALFSVHVIKNRGWECN